MKIILLPIGALFLLAGLVLGFLTNRHRNPGAPHLPSFNPVHWFQPWIVYEWLTPKGIKLYSISYAFMMFGIMLIVYCEKCPPGL